MKKSASGRINGAAAMVLAGVAALFGLIAWLQFRNAHRLLVADVPVSALVIAQLNPEDAYPERFPMQVAILRTATDESLLPVVHAFRQMGIPFFVTRDLQKALRHHLIFLYPRVDTNSFTPAQIEQLRRHVESGGSIFAQAVTNSTLQPLFGFREVAASKQRHVVRFAPGADPILRYLNRPEELEVRLGSPQIPEIFWTQGYTPAPGAGVLARYDDGSAALLRNRIGKGATYLCGIGLVDVVLRNQTNRHYDAFRHYVNAFEPGGDVWPLIERAWYETSEPGAVRLATIPEGGRSVVLFTHDVDWEDSFPPMLIYARMEAEHHARSLFFIQMKYVDDFNGRGYLYPSNLDVLRQVHALGFPMGTHSIIHSRAFNSFALGAGTETYASYHPRGTSATTAADATVFGEVRVSRELLDGNVPGQHTVFFRAGHLRVPKSLPEALARCGYEFDSSFTAPDVLSNFPYALTLGLLFDQDSGLYEFPVTFEDEEAPPLLDRVPAMLEVIAANAENGAPNVVLIHTNEAKKKFEAEKAMLERLPPGVRAMDPLEFAAFWRARDRLRWSVTPRPTGRELDLEAVAEEPVRGIAFEFAQSLAGISSGATLLDDHRTLVLDPMKPGKAVRITIHLQ